MKRQGMVLLSIVLFSFAGCGQSNIFSWAHSPGSSSSTSSLSVDASQALQNKDYAKAMQYYSQILKSNPNNSQAIYGYCSAELASSGIDIASLVSNLVVQNNNGNNNNNNGNNNNNNNNPSFSRLASALAYAAHAPASNSLLPSDIIKNEVAIKKALNIVLGSQYLLKIVEGKGDGTIAPDNPDVNVNIAFCLVLLAALKVNDYGIVTFNNDYTVTVPASTTVSNTQVINDADDFGRDIISAYYRLMVVVKKLNLDNNAMVSQIESDVQTLFGNLQTAIPGINLNTSTDYYLSGQY